MSLITISICMIVKNKESIIKESLIRAKKIADELIVIDLGSNDKTVEIAKQYADRLETFSWIEVYSSAKKHAASIANSQYIMWMEAEDSWDKETEKQLLRLKNDLIENVDIIYCTYRNNSQYIWADQAIRARIIKKENIISEKDNLAKLLFPEIIIEYKKEMKHDFELESKIYDLRLEAGGNVCDREHYYCARSLYNHGCYKEAEEYLSYYQEKFEPELIPEITMIKCLSLNALNRSQEAMEIAYNSLKYDVLRAHTCCFIGDGLLSNKEYDKAIGWYKHAMLISDLPEDFHIDLYHYHTFYPMKKLAECYYDLGDIEKFDILNNQINQISLKKTY